MNRTRSIALAFGLALFSSAALADSSTTIQIEIEGRIRVNGLEVAPEGSMTTIGIGIGIDTSGPPPPDTAAPAAPQNLVATPGDSTVALAWDANSEPDLVGYNVYRDSGAGFGLFAAAVLTNSYADNAVSNGTSYDYYVTAYDDADNESDPSDTDSATPADTTAPDAPSAPTLTPGDTEIEVTLPSLSDDIVGFRVYTSLDDMSYAEDTATPQTSSWTITGLTNGALVYVKISAEDEAANESALSDASSETPASAGISDLGDLTSGVFWYSPRKGTWTIISGTPDTVDEQPDELGGSAGGVTLEALFAARRPEAAYDHFGSGLHAWRIYTQDYLTGTSGFPSGLNDFSLVMALDSAIATNVLNAYIWGLNGSSFPDSTSATYGQWTSSRVLARLGSPENLSATATSTINTTTGPAVIRVVRYRGTGSGDGYWRIYVNGVMEAEHTGLSLESWTGGNVYLGHVAGSSNGAYYIGDTWLGTDEADGVTAEEFLVDLLGITP